MPSSHPSLSTDFTANTQQLIGALAEFKFGITRWLLLHTNLGVAWLFNTTFSLLLVAGSSALVVGLAPAAVSSGVPEVMAYLNGVLTRLLCASQPACAAHILCSLRRGVS